MFGVDPQPLAAASDERHCCRAGQDRLDHLGGGIEDVLAVVEDDQEPAADERLGDAVRHAEAGLGGDAQRGRDRIGHGRGIADRSQLHQPDPVRELVRQGGGDLKCEAGLADATDAGQGHEPVRVHQLGQLRHLELAPDEARGLRREVARRRVERAERGEVGVADLPEVLGRAQVLQAMGSEVAEAVSGDQPSDHVRHDDLSAVAGGHQPGGAIQSRPEVVSRTLLCLACVQSHPCAQLDGLRPRFGEQLLLGRSRRLDRCGR